MILDAKTLSKTYGTLTAPIEFKENMVMKLSKLAASAAVLTVVVSLSSPVLAATLKNKTDRVSYAMGLETGMALKSHDAKVNPDVFAAGLRDAMSGNKPSMSKDEVTQTLRGFQQESMKKIQKKMAGLAKVNQQASQKFLAVNKSKPGVVTLNNGLQYKVIQKGTGAKPQASQTVTVDYEGKLVNGKVFDSSYQRGKSAEFPVNGVIPGWTQALQLMRAGATWMIYIPAKLAYGERGVPGVIEPNSALIFKVHLVKINA